MTYEQVTDMVESVGIPYTYYQFPQNTERPCPYICYFYEMSEDFSADNVNYQKIRPLAIELYTDVKDFALEARVESVLKQHELFFTREETYLDSERMYMVTFTANIILTEE